MESSYALPTQSPSAPWFRWKPSYLGISAKWGNSTIRKYDRDTVAWKADLSHPTYIYWGCPLIVYSAFTFLYELHSTQFSSSSSQLLLNLGCSTAMGQYWQVVAPGREQQLTTLLWGKLGCIFPGGYAGHYLQQQLMVPLHKQSGHTSD